MAETIRPSAAGAELSRVFSRFKIPERARPIIEPIVTVTDDPESFSTRWPGEADDYPDWAADEPEPTAEPVKEQFHALRVETES